MALFMCLSGRGQRSVVRQRIAILWSNPEVGEAYLAKEEEHVHGAGFRDGGVVWIRAMREAV